MTVNEPSAIESGPKDHFELTVEESDRLFDCIPRDRYRYAGQSAVAERVEATVKDILTERVAAAREALVQSLLSGLEDLIGEHDEQLMPFEDGFAEGVRAARDLVRPTANHTLPPRRIEAPVEAVALSVHPEGLTAQGKPSLLLAITLASEEAIHDVIADSPSVLASNIAQALSDRIINALVPSPSPVTASDESVPSPAAEALCPTCGRARDDRTVGPHAEGYGLCPESFHFRSLRPAAVSEAPGANARNIQSEGDWQDGDQIAVMLDGQRLEAFTLRGQQWHSAKGVRPFAVIERWLDESQVVHVHAPREPEAVMAPLPTEPCALRATVRGVGRPLVGPDEDGRWWGIDGCDIAPESIESWEPLKTYAEWETQQDHDTVRVSKDAVDRLRQQDLRKPHYIGDRLARAIRDFLSDVDDDASSSDD